MSTFLEMPEADMLEADRVDYLFELLPLPLPRNMHPVLHESVSLLIAN